MEMKFNDFLGLKAVDLGFADSKQVMQALSEQHERTKKGKHIRIGTLMEEMGIITHLQLKDLLEKCKPNPLTLSEDAASLASKLKVSLRENDRTIMLTGVSSLDGVSTTASQLAIALSIMEQEHVLLIDANLRSPSQHSFFSIKQTPGLTDYLGENEKIEKVIYKVSPTLSVLPSGNTVTNFLPLLMSERLSHLIESLGRNYRYILIDSPPATKHPDCAPIASVTDGTVIVLSPGDRTKSELFDVKRTLKSLNSNIFGIVFFDQRDKEPS